MEHRGMGQGVGRGVINEDEGRSYVKKREPGWGMV